MHSFLPSAGKKFVSHRSRKLGKKHFFGTLKKIGQKALAKGESVAAHGIVGGVVGGALGGPQGVLPGAAAGASKAIF